MAIACAVSQARKDRAAPTPPPPPPAILGLDGRPDGLPDAAFVEVARKECAACHVLPAPGDVPRGLWHQRLQDMTRFSLTGIGVRDGTPSGLARLELEPFVRYFETRAPETLPAPPAWPPAEGAGARFARHLLSPPGAAPVPILANVRFLDLDGDGRLEIVACDMGHGLVLLGDPARRPGELREIAKIPNHGAAQAGLAVVDRLVHDVPGHSGSGPTSSPLWSRPRIGRIAPNPTRPDAASGARVGPLASMRPTSPWSFPQPRGAVTLTCRVRAP